jgi:hypothetical protein
MDHLEWVKRCKKLSVMLIVSITLNVALLIGGFALSIQEPLAQYSLSNSVDSDEKFTNIALLRDYSKLSFRELVSLLTNKELVEEGYFKRDLALSALVSYHHFDIEKALGSDFLVKRRISEESVDLFPGLTEDQFSAIVKFAYQEKWPLKGKGLFLLLKKLPEEPTLIEAFMMTPEMYALSVLFQKTGAPQDMKTLVQLVKEGTWEILDQFGKEQTNLLELTVEKRRRVLLSFLAHQSRTAANLLVATDRSFISNKLDDQALFQLVDSILDKTDETVLFCKGLLSSRRSDKILSKVKAKLLQWHEVVEVGKSVLKDELVELPPVFDPQEAPAKRAVHTVEAGETLWRISKHYQVSVQDIIEENGIEAGKIQPGMELKIPKKSSR